MAIRVLVCWIGDKDLEAAGRKPSPHESRQALQCGPIAATLDARGFDEVVLLNDRPHLADDAEMYFAWLTRRADGSGVRLRLRQQPLPSAMDYGAIYENAVQVLTEIRQEYGNDLRLALHLSPGTPAMAAIWLILGKTQFPAELIDASFEEGIRTVDFPFALSAEFLRDRLRQHDEWLATLAGDVEPGPLGFDAVLHDAPAMRHLVGKAWRAAQSAVPVLLEGETGTGKELLARAIHAASRRHNRPFVPVNCGAIPTELIESELFGHVKGAFTGATKDRDGHFVTAHRGTLFLDEIGELPPAGQIRLLRVVQDGSVLPLGSSKTRQVDVRIVAATNRDLIREVRRGVFREDLFYRLTVAYLRVPPLRARGNDLDLIIDATLARMNRELRAIAGPTGKALTPAAREALRAHTWPGNVRELQNTLARAVLFAPGQTLEAADVQEATLWAVHNGSEGAEYLERPFIPGFDLDTFLTEVERHYLDRAWAQSGGRPTQAARLLGMSHQTFTNRRAAIEAGPRRTRRRRALS